MSRPIFAVICLGLLSVAAQAAVGTAPFVPNRAHYHRCLADSSANPAAALADAENWIKAGGGVPAEHCAALSLVNLKRYSEAGARLDRIASGRAILDVQFRIALYDQAGNAWLLAGEGAKAVQSLTGALTLSAGDPDLFTDMARAQAMVRNWHEVVLDLNAALQLSPRRADLLVLRASARRALKHYVEARADIDNAVKLKPGDSDALVESGLLRKQVGDLGGARRDFEAALKGASAETAAEAREHLDALKP